MRYNFGCALTMLRESDAALDVPDSVFDRMDVGLLSLAKVDPDLAPLRDNPRFQAMVAAAERRLAASSGAD